MTPNQTSIKRLLVLLIALLALLAFAMIWWGLREVDRREALEDDVAGLSVALEEAHEENPGEVPSPEEVVDDPPIVIQGEDGEDGRDGRDPTPEEIAAAAEAWLMQNITDQPDPDDSESDDPDPDDPDPDDPETQDPEIDDPEVQDPEEQDPEIQDPEVDDPDPGTSFLHLEIPWLGNKTLIIDCVDENDDGGFSMGECTTTEV